jgi:hypothetical protein
MTSRYVVSTRHTDAGEGFICPCNFEADTAKDAARARFEKLSNTSKATTTHVLVTAPGGESYVFTVRPFALEPLR